MISPKGTNGNGDGVYGRRVMTSKHSVPHKPLVVDRSQSDFRHAACQPLKLRDWFCFEPRIPKSSIVLMAETTLSIQTVAVIGAGVSGVAAAIHLKKAGLEVTIYERNATAGGIW